MIRDGVSPMGGFILRRGMKRAARPRMTAIRARMSAYAYRQWLGAVVVGCAERCRGRTLDKRSGN